MASERSGFDLRRSSVPSNAQLGKQSNYSLKDKAITEKQLKSTILALQATSRDLVEENSRLKKEILILNAKVDVLQHEKQLHLDSYIKEKHTREKERSVYKSDMKKVKQECKEECQNTIKLVSQTKEMIYGLINNYN